MKIASEKVVPPVHYIVYESCYFGEKSLPVRDIVENVIRHCDAGMDKLSVMRMTFFVDVPSSDELSMFTIAGGHIIKNCFENKIPPFSFVAQPPGNKGKVLCEATFFRNGGRYSLTYKNAGETPYLVLSSPSIDEIVVAGITSEPGKSCFELVPGVFSKMEDILKREGMEFSNIIRQWAYIGDITGIYNGKQNYQVFNNVRAEYYSGSSNWLGYPAATGIGMNSEGFVVDFIAAKLKSNIKRIPLKNPVQIDAYKYSEMVLVGDNYDKCMGTPRFERAMVIWDREINRVFISGTAAITGENINSGLNVEDQANITLDNIEALIGVDNLMNSIEGIVFHSGDMSILRGYVKYESDIPVVEKAIRERYPYVPLVVVRADVCRDELLVEIEGEYWFS